MQQADEAQYVVIIHQGLTRPHDDNRIDFAALPLCPQHIVDGDGLGEDFPRRQIACHAVQRRRAERTAHTAAGLRRNADAVAIRLAHEYRLYRRAISKFQ